MEEALRRRCRLSRLKLWKLLLTAVLLGANKASSQRTEVEITPENADRFPRLLERASPGTTFILATNVNLSSTASIRSTNVTIRGNPRATRSVVRCSEGVAMAFRVSSDSAQFAHLEIRNCKGTAVSVSSVEENPNPFANQGASGRTDPTPLRVEFQNVSFVNNGARDEESAGAMFIGRRVTAEIDNCSFENNTAVRGGAIHSQGTALQINNSVFSNNIAVNSGGAVSGSAHLRDHEQERRVSIHGTQFLENRVLQGNQDSNPLTMRSSGFDVEANQYLKFPRPTLSGGALSLADFTSITVTDSEFRGNSAVPAGGGIYLSDNAETEIWSCTFSDNFVSPIAEQRDNAQGLQAGGAIYVAFQDPSSRLDIEASRFTNNTAVYGGALHVVAPVSSTITVAQSNFTDNRARLGGGAITFRNVNSPVLSGCEFVQNSAFVGGAVFVTNGAGLNVYQGGREPRPNFRDNIALDGGAVFGIGTGAVKFADLEFVRNQAYRRGGAICFLDSKFEGEFILQDARLLNNTAEKGGALFLENMEQVDILATSDQADRNQLNIQVLSDEVDTFFSNAAIVGGAIYYKASNQFRNTLTLARSRFVSNKVYSDLSAIYPEPLDHPGRNERVSGGLERRIRLENQTESSFDESLLDPSGAEPCYPGGGGAICFVLNRLSERVPVTIRLFNSSFENNIASVGGGLFLSTEEGVEWSSECRPANDPCRILTLRNLIFLGNFARFAGGGLFASNLTHVYYSSAESEHSSVSYLPLAKSSYKEDLATSNSVEDGGYGPNIASMAVSLRIKEPTPDPKTELLINNHSSGQSNPLPTIRIEILDEMGQVVSAGIEDSSLRVRANAELYNRSIVSSQIDAVAKAGVANFSALAILAPAGIYTLEFEPPRPSIKSINSTVEIRACLLGEITNTEGFICEMCDVEFFSLDTKRKKCDACPAHARCGGASIVPLPNYWHSSPFSTIMLKCFNRDVCRYEGRTLVLENQHNISRREFFDRLQNGEDNQVFSNEEYSQCADGYTGPLCGSCKDGYGRTDSKTCRECENKRVTSAVVLGITLWQLFLMGFTLKIALVSLKDMNQVLMIVENRSSAFATTTVFPMASDPNARAHGLSHLGETFNDRQNAGITHKQLHESYEKLHEQLSAQVDRVTSLETAPQQQMLVEYAIAVEHVAETLKIFVNFLQMTSVAISINADWTKTVKEMLTTMNLIAALSSGASFTPLTCLFDRNMDYRSIYGEVLRFFIRLGIILCFVLYYSIRWLIMIRRPNSTRAQCMTFLRSRIIISFLVFMLYSYHSLSEEFMGMVSCIALDSKEINNATPYREYSIATGWYWTVDTRIKCFERKHAFLAVFLGIPGIIFILFGVPLHLLFFLLCKRSKGKLLDLDVLNPYGVIYQTYREKFVFWEVCILARKALIGAVVVFAYTLGSNLQGVMAQGVLILALSVHLTVVPFKYTILNILEGCSLLVSIFTFYAGVVFNDENTTHALAVFLSISMVLINLVLVLAFWISMAYYGDKSATARLRILGVHDIPRNLILRSWKLANVVSGQALLSIRDTIRDRFYRSRVQTNGSQTAVVSETSDTNQLLISQLPAEYSDVVRDWKGQNEMTVEMTQDRSNKRNIR